MFKLRQAFPFGLTQQLMPQNEGTIKLYVEGQYVKTCLPQLLDDAAAYD